VSAARVDRVVVGISGSLGNLAALHAAVAHAQRADAQLVAVVAWTPVGGDFTFPRATGTAVPTRLPQQAQSTLMGAFTDAFGGAPPDVPIASIIARGFAGAVLVNEASRPGDLLVVGAGRRGRLARLRRGSVKRYCLAHARCPVLAVPQPDMISQLHFSRRAWRKHDAARPVGTSPGGRITGRRS
jgi:nucleotide-binding universal stress UspA family protein